MTPRSPSPWSKTTGVFVASCRCSWREPPGFDLAFAAGSVEEALRIAPDAPTTGHPPRHPPPGTLRHRGRRFHPRTISRRRWCSCSRSSRTRTGSSRPCATAPAVTCSRRRRRPGCSSMSARRRRAARPCRPRSPPRSCGSSHGCPSEIAVDEHLTPQETNFLKLLAEGHSYGSSADELGVSVNTVRNYVRSIYDKLHVHSKSEAVSKAMRAGMI